MRGKAFERGVCVILRIDLGFKSSLIYLIEEEGVGVGRSVVFFCCSYETSIEKWTCFLFKGNLILRFI